MEINHSHYATLRELCFAYSGQFGRIDNLVKSAKTEGFPDPYRWAGYAVLSKSPTFGGFVEMLRYYMSDAEIDAAVVRVAIDVESKQRR